MAVSTHSRPKAAGSAIAAPTSSRICFNSQPPEGGWLMLTENRTLTLVSTHSRPKAAGICLARAKTKNLFQLTAARRRLDADNIAKCLDALFQLTAARRRLVCAMRGHRCIRVFQLTAARRRLASPATAPIRHAMCFNSQPPEGGWQYLIDNAEQFGLFQLTAARRRLGENQLIIQKGTIGFNSQPPEGGWVDFPAFHRACSVSTHSRPKAAGRVLNPTAYARCVSTHSRPKAAGPVRFHPKAALQFQLTAARRRLGTLAIADNISHRFQLTAARRRLVELPPPEPLPEPVSTHSRPKAAGRLMLKALRVMWRFNSQPPEGGWSHSGGIQISSKRFNSQPPEGGW